MSGRDRTAIVKLLSFPHDQPSRLVQSTYRRHRPLSPQTRPFCRFRPWSDHVL